MTIIIIIFVIMISMSDGIRIPQACRGISEAYKRGRIKKQQIC